jgi:hypothetical protein
VGLGAKRLDDPVSGKRLGTDVRDVLERLLAPSGRPPHALSQPDQRIHDERRAGDADDRQTGIEVEEQGRQPDERERLAHEIGDRFGHHLLHLPDVVVDARHQLAGGPLREKAGRLTENVTVQRVAQVHHHPLPDVGRQVRRDIRAHALEQVDADDRPGHLRQVFLERQGLVDDRPDDHGQSGRAGRIQQHGDG